jgi:hypothetical protein
LIFYIYYTTKAKKSQPKNHQKQEKMRILVENETQSQLKIKAYIIEENNKFGRLSPADKRKEN